MDEIRSAVIDLVERFVERQRLVQAVMRDLRPDLLEEDAMRRYAMPTWTNPPPNSGCWGEQNEWRYYFHGCGCELTHVKTGERVDWDAPDVYAFDGHWFVTYVQWCFSNLDHPMIRQLKNDFCQQEDSLHDFVLTTLQELVCMGVLSQPDPYNWTKFRLNGL